MFRVNPFDVFSNRQAPEGVVEAERGRQRLSEEDAVNGPVRGERVQDRSETFLVRSFDRPADGNKVVPLELSLDLAQVRRRGRVFACLHDRETGRRRAAGGEAGSAPLDVRPDLIGDRASEQGLRGQTRTPI
jgi:hypothetical protein